MRSLSVLIVTLSVSNPSMADPALRSGEDVFNTTCTVCHSTGANGAPRFGNRTDWRPRIAQGKPTLYQHALNGYKGMPPRGACASCTDREIRVAVDYMVSKARKPDH